MSKLSAKDPKAIERASFRSVFISDLHLGSAGCKVEQVNEFLKCVECEHLYLVGDIFDGWVGFRDGKWKQAHSNVIRTILGMSKSGTNIYYTPGNHDSFARRLNGADLGNTLVDHSFDHTLANGDRYLVVHGDLFDRTVTKYLPVAYVSAWVYEFVSMLNNSVNNQRRRRQLGPVEFGPMLKRAVKMLVSRSTNYEDLLAEYARENGYDGVVCGHVHRPRMEELYPGFVYANAGDWVEHCTALLEHHDGTMELVLWSEFGPKVCGRGSSAGEPGTVPSEPSSV